MPKSLSTSHKENLLWIFKRNYENKKIRIVEEESNTLNRLVFEKKLDLKFPDSISLKKEKSLGEKSYVLAEVICPSS